MAHHAENRMRLKKRIESLAPERVAKFGEYVRMGVEQGLSTAAIDEEEGKRYAVKLMNWLGRDYKGTIFVDSPLAACCVTHLVAVVEMMMSSGVIAPRDKVWAQVRAQVGDQVWAQVWDQVQVTLPYLTGQWFSYYSAWYRYLSEVLELELSDIWVIEEQVQFGGVYPLSGFVIISRRPSEIHRNADGRLHRDGGASVRYDDGFSVFALNGVRVPEWLAVKREDEIDPAEFAGIENAEVRREFVRKVGIERIATAIGAVTLDKRGDYELLRVNLGGASGENYCLKMLNPSTGTWHMEFVPPGVATVKDALHWRNQSELQPVQLT